MSSSASNIDVPAHVAAVVITAAMMVLLGWLLLRVPVAAPVATDDEAMQVFFIARPRHAAARVVSRAHVASPAAIAPTLAAPSPAPAEMPRIAATPKANSVTGEIYATDGRIRLPAGMAIDPLKPAAAPPGEPDERTSKAAKQLLERRNPIDYRPTRFDKDWASDGTLGDVALEKIGNHLHGFSDLSKFVLGEDHPATARPPPDVRFNPALHERKSDLGSEATGDAYKAAPIAFEHAPDLKGEASRRIRSRAEELQKRFASCDPQRLQRLLAPVRANIVQLEHIEYAMAHGVDPTQAEHLMPRSADMAYDLARRALWYAENKLVECRR